MRLHELYPFPQDQKARKRLGRGSGSGTGCTSGKGNKGQNSRKSGGVRPGFEGGQMPLQRRLPKRGFTNLFKIAYTPVNLDRLIEAFPEQKEISIMDIYGRGLCKPGAPVKILARGDLSVAITVEAHRFSAAAAEKITAAGGTPKALEN